MDLDPRAPADFDLSGTWLLVPEQSDTVPPRRLLRSRGGLLSFVTQDFPALHAQRMKIEQSADSMGIAYDEGGYRDISWGNRRRGLWEVDAGWHDGRLVILSEAEDAEAREVLTLSNGGRELSMEIFIRSSGGDLAVTRVFHRAGG